MEEEYKEIDLTEDEWDFIVEHLESKVVEWEKYLTFYPHHNWIRKAKNKAKRIIEKIKV